MKVVWIVTTVSKLKPVQTLIFLWMNQITYYKPVTQNSDETKKMPILEVT